MFHAINLSAHLAILPGLGVLDDLPEWILRHHGDGMRIEVMS
jgi:hypothetical protein